MTNHPTPGPTVASLLPSATEHVCALGARERLVGRSHECDFPAGLEDVPVLTRSELPDGEARSSGEIHGDVMRQLERGLAIYHLDRARLDACRPDVVITQDLCEVCAVPASEVRAACAELFGQGASSDGPELIALDPRRLSDIFDDLERIGRALDLEAKAASVRQELEARLDALRDRAPKGERKTVLTLEWLDPPMVGGTWMPELVEFVGGTPLVGRAGEKAPILGRAELEALSPEVVLIKVCGFDLERLSREEATLSELFRDLDWPALREHRVWATDGSAFFNRPGPRIVESAEILAACVHPQTFADLGAKHASALRTLRPSLLHD